MLICTRPEIEKIAKKYAFCYFSSFTNCCFNTKENVSEKVAKIEDVQ
jgi:hypothetical protein